MGRCRLPATVQIGHLVWAPKKQLLVYVACLLLRHHSNHEAQTSKRIAACGFAKRMQSHKRQKHTRPCPPDAAAFPTQGAPDSLGFADYFQSEFRPIADAREPFARCSASEQGHGSHGGGQTGWQIGSHTGTCRHTLTVTQYGSRCTSYAAPDSSFSSGTIRHVVYGTWQIAPPAPSCSAGSGSSRTSLPAPAGTSYTGCSRHAVPAPSCICGTSASGSDPHAPCWQVVYGM